MRHLLFIGCLVLGLTVSLEALAFGDAVVAKINNLADNLRMVGLSLVALSLMGFCIMLVFGIRAYRLGAFILAGGCGLGFVGSIANWITQA